MGCSLSRSTSTISASKNRIRVVHLNGYVQDFEYPVSAGEVTGSPAKQQHFLCTPAQLMLISNTCTKSNALQPDAMLEAGHVYFLLPYSTLHPDVSPMDLVAIARKLTAKAKSTKSTTLLSSSNISSSHPSPPPSRSPGRSPNLNLNPNLNLLHGGRKTSHIRSWRPVLDTIREKSFNRKSESDLHET